jgi:hypothetical protein
MAQKPQLLSGARGVFQKSNPQTGVLETVAFVTNVSINRRVGTRVSYVIGRMNGAAHDPLSYDVDVSIGRVLPMNDVNGQSNGSWPSPVANGQASAAAAPTMLVNGLEPTIAKMTTDDDFVLAIFDAVTGQYVSSVKHCRYAGGSLGLSAGDIGNETLNYVGIYDGGYGGDENAATTGYGLGA